MPPNLRPIQFFLDERSPFTRDFVIAKDQTLPQIDVQVMDFQKPISLIGHTVTFSMINTEDDALKIDDVAGSIVTGQPGVARYTWVAGDVDTAAIYFGVFKITNTASSLIYTVPNNTTQRLRIIIGSTL